MHDPADPLAAFARSDDPADIGRLQGIEPLIRNYTSMFGLVGAKAARIVADRWIAPSGDTIQPAPGKYTLIVFRPHRGNIPALRRLAEQHRDQLNVVGVSGTIGFFRDLGPLTPELEVEELQKYYTKDLKVSMPIAVNFTEWEKLPDGRRNPQPTPNESAYRARTGATVMLIDPRGVIKQIWVSWDKSYEGRIETALSRLGESK